MNTGAGPSAIGPRRESTGAWHWRVLCLAAFTINLDTTIVNIALPSLMRQLDASTRELQWVVDAYTLTFAALVLAAGAWATATAARAPCSSGWRCSGAPPPSAGWWTARAR